MKPHEDMVSLGDPYDSFIERQVAIGRYEDPREVLRAGLRLLEHRDAQMERLRRAVDAPEDAFDDDGDDGAFRVGGRRR